MLAFIAALVYLKLLEDTNSCCNQLTMKTKPRSVIIFNIHLQRVYDFFSVFNLLVASYMEYSQHMLFSIAMRMTGYPLYFQLYTEYCKGIQVNS